MGKIKNTKQKIFIAIACLLVLVVAYFIFTNQLSQRREGFSPPYGSESDKPDEWLMAFHDLRHTGYTSARPPYEVENVYLKWKYETGSWIYSSPAVADIDGDGETEVVFGSSDNNIYALSGENGELEWSFSTSKGWEYNAIFTSPAIINVRDETNIVVGARNGRVFYLSGKDGTLRWSKSLDGEVIPSPAIVDLDNDGDLEILIGDEKVGLYSLSETDGGIEWLYEVDRIHHSSPAVADLNNDGYLEVVVSGLGGSMHAIRDDGELIWGINTNYGAAYSSATIADVDNDGSLEIIQGAYYSLQVFSYDGSEKYTINIMNDIRTTPAVADVDNDGELEIIVGLHQGNESSSTPNGGIMSVTASNGEIEWQSELGNITSSSPVIADIDGDDELEIVLGADDGKVYCFDGKTGSLEWTYATNGEIRGSLVVADIDGDQIPEILVPSYDGNLYVLSLI